MIKNGTTKTYIAIAGLLLTLILAGAGALKAWYVLPVEVSNHAKQAKEDKDINKAEHVEMELAIDKVEEKCVEIVGIKKDVEYLSIKVDRNWEEQKQFQTEQKTLTKEILAELKK